MWKQKKHKNENAKLTTYTNYLRSSDEMTKIPGEISCFGRGRGGKPAVEMLWCIAIASNDGMGSANKPSLFISAERAVLAMINELYKEEPFSHAILSNSRSSKEFRCCFNSLGRVSSCLTKLSITLLKSKAVMPVLSKTTGNNMVTVLCVAKTSSAEQASMHL